MKEMSGEKNSKTEEKKTKNLARFDENVRIHCQTIGVRAENGDDGDDNDYMEALGCKIFAHLPIYIYLYIYILNFRLILGSCTSAHHFNTTDVPVAMWIH